MTTNEIKPCAKCGGKLRPVQSGDGAINALYCDKCKTIHMLNDKYKSMEATIERYNSEHAEQTGDNDAD